MSLINTYRHIEPIEGYPDRIQLHIQINDVPRLSPDAVRWVMRSYGLRRSRRRRVQSGALRDFAGTCIFPASVYRPHPGAPLSFYMDINPLSFMHEQRRATEYRGERSYDADAVNWLHPSDIGPDNRSVWQVADDLAGRALDTARWMVECYAREHDQHTAVQGVGVSIASIEIAVDFLDAERGYAIDQFAGVFRRNLHSVVVQHYRTSAFFYERWDRCIRTVRAFRNAGEAYKAYPKTNRRVRLEAALAKEALENAGIHLSLAEHHNSLVDFIRAVAAFVTPTFNVLISDLRHNDQTADSASVVELITAIGRRLGRAQNAALFWRCLLDTDRIDTNLFDRQAIAKLVYPDGVLRPGHRGFRVLTSRYCRAAQLLKEAGQSFFPLLRRLVLARRRTGPAYTSPAQAGLDCFLRPAG